MQNVPEIVVTCSNDARIQLNRQISDTPFLTSDWHNLILFLYEIKIFSIIRTVLTNK